MAGTQPAAVDTENQRTVPPRAKGGAGWKEKRMRERARAGGGRAAGPSARASATARGAAERQKDLADVRTPSASFQLARSTTSAMRSCTA